MEPFAAPLDDLLASLVLFEFDLETSMLFLGLRRHGFKDSASSTDAIGETTVIAWEGVANGEINALSTGLSSLKRPNDP
jgi:hypothetical protein